MHAPRQIARGFRARPKAAPLQALGKSRTMRTCQGFRVRVRRPAQVFFIWQSPCLTVFLEHHREYEFNPNPFCKA